MGKQSGYTNEQLIKLIQAGIDTQENYLKLYQQNGGFIHNTIKKYIHEPIMEYEDLMQQSYIALTRAVCYYNAELEETNFLGILKFCIKNSIAELRGTPRGINNLIVKYRKIKRDIENNTGEVPTDAEMMLYMDITERTLKNIKTGLLLQNTSSLDESLTEDTETTKKDLLIDDTSTDYQQSIEDRELKYIITKALDTLPSKQRNIIIERYVRGRTLDDIAEELNCNKSYINTIERKALTELRRNKEVVAALEEYIPPPTIYTKRSIDSIVIDSIKREETFKNAHTNNDLQDMLYQAFTKASNQ